MVKSTHNKSVSRPGVPKQRQRTESIRDTLSTSTHTRPPCNSEVGGTPFRHDSATGKGLGRGRGEPSWEGKRPEKPFDEITNPVNAVSWPVIPTRQRALVSA